VSDWRSIVPITHALLPQATLVLERVLRDTPYLDGALDALRAAVQSPGTDGRAMGTMIEDHLESVIVFGFFGGADGAGRVQLAVVEPEVRRARIGWLLVEDAAAQLGEEGARFVLAELPDDPRALPGAREFLKSVAFSEESRVENFYRDGVSLLFMRREIAQR
jgi:ribosomal protein S18 acetylase RimI-like enzyme